MSDESPKYLVKRRPRIHTDARGRSEWLDPVASAELELVSTLKLQKILKSSDEKSRRALREAAEGAGDGVLARDTENGRFEIIRDEDLQAILDENKHLPPVRKPSDVVREPVHDDAVSADDELSLVSTQTLRKVLRKNRHDAGDEPVFSLKGGFDPYNSR
jgi:hypothetical protein